MSAITPKQGQRACISREMYGLRSKRRRAQSAEAKQRRQTRFSAQIWGQRCWRGSEAVWRIENNIGCRQPVRVDQPGSSGPRLISSCDHQEHRAVQAWPLRQWAAARAPDQGLGSTRLHPMRGTSPTSWPLGRSGQASIVAQARRIASGPRPRRVHLTTNIVITLNGDTATVGSNWTLVQNSPNGPIIGSGGAYDDHLVKRGGHWCFQRRTIDRFIAEGRN